MVKSDLTADNQRPKFLKPIKVLVVVAPYYKEISDNLVSGATAEITTSGAEFDVVDGRPQRIAPCLGLEPIDHNHINGMCALHR